jgi:hypothetical protein
MWLLILSLFVIEPARAEITAPESLKAKWSEVKETAVHKYEKVRTSDFGEKVQRKAVEAKNSNFAKDMMSKASHVWQKLLVKGKSLLSSADKKLHEKLDLH